MRTIPPTRVGHTYVQKLNAPPERVFPLLCPVREAEWVKGWDPSLVISSSGVAEPGCIFTTPGPGGESIWVVTVYRPEEHRIEFLKVTPGETVGQIEIALRPDGAGGTAANVSYTYTALGPAGERFVASFTAEAWRAFMREWEDELNHFLATGRQRPAAS
jgi:hypothetical protein